MSGGQAIGAIGAGLGHQIGGRLFISMGGVDAQGLSAMPARIAAFIPMGAMIGMAVGWIQLSTRGLLSGLLGGLIAGAVTGAIFDPLSIVLAPATQAVTGGSLPAGLPAESGAPGRAVLGIGLGIFIGTFTALMDRATRQAWLRLVLGRNEGREWPIDAAQTTIGRDERAHVPLFGDMNVVPLHAVIERRGAQYVLIDQGSPIGTGWNSQRIGEAVLSPGDQIQIGSFNLQFLMKAGAASRAMEGRAHGQPVGGQQPGQPIQPIQQPGYTPQQPQPMPTQPVQPTGQQTVAMQPMPQTGQQTVAMQPMTGLALVAENGPLAGQRIPIAGPMEIGREASGIQLSYDAKASRHHASVTPQGNTLVVQDLGSTNGTLVNGQRVQQAVLNLGDVLQIGTTKFRVE